jgi:hypothetical protein
MAFLILFLTLILTIGFAAIGFAAIGFAAIGFAAISAFFFCANFTGVSL